MRKYLLLILSFVFHFSALSADNYTFCYWVDDNHTAAQTITQATNKFSTTMDVASLPEGLHTLFVRARKNTGSWTSPKASHFYKVLDPTTVKTYYWFNDNEDNRFEVTKTNGETFTIDVSHLSDGTHTLHVRMEGEGTASSATVSNQFLKISTNFSAYYWFDNETERHEYANAGGSSMLIDVSHLKEGLHCFNAMLLNDSGTPTSVVSRTFLKIAQPTANDSTMLTFWIDGKQHSEQKVAYGNEIVDFELDVADLSTGMHYLKVQAMTNSGATSNIASAYFMRMPYQNSDGVIAYRYWVNDNNANLPFTAVENPTIPYELIGDLDVVPQPLRCANFHFEVNNDMPMLYAVNDLHVQFMAADGHLIKSVNQYVESIAADTLTDEKWTEIKNDTVIKANTPTGETIYWYAMNLEEGDTICLKTNYSSTLQLFSHSGNQVFESKADSSLIFRQFIAEKAEMYYVALHTVNTTKAQVTLTVDLNKLIHYYTVATSTNGHGTVTEGGIYAEGTLITLTATPNEGHQFARWNDGNTDNPRTLVLTQDTALTAYFEYVVLDTEYKTICYGDSCVWNGKTYTTSGIYIDTLQTGIATLDLTILPEVPITNEEAVICSSEVYEWQGQTYTKSGTYSVTLSDINGCDSILTLNLTVNYGDTIEFTETACDSYEWHGEVYTKSGDYTYLTQTTLGCDSLEVLHLTINYADTVEYTEITCDSYEWHGEFYTKSGDYTYLTQTTLGCDSLEVLHLTINYADTVEYTETACDSYEWHGEVYTKSGDYTYLTQTTNGCDSLEVLHLTINYADTVEYTETACDSYEWHGEVYTKSGDYTYLTQTTLGCDSLEVLHLTINHSEVAPVENVTVCYGETYTWNGRTYSTAGEYTITLSNTNGCDSVATLQLTIMPEAVITTETVVIGSNELPYTWRGQSINATGRYTDIELYTTITCDSAIHVLDLTVLTTGNYDEQSVTICETEAPYIWYGESYFTTGKYTHTEKYAGTDIDSIQHILNLTVNSTVYTEEHITACDSYTWNGSTYTTTGAYTYTTVATNGCDSIVTLHLTINHSEVALVENVTVCYGETYTWNGRTYSTAGEYTITLSNTNGCDSVATLHLTIMPEAVTTTETVVIGSNELPYTWRGQSINATGRYTDIEQYTTITCDSAIHVLDLTVLTTGNYDEQSVTICETEAPYIWYGKSYFATGKYTDTEKYAGTDIDSIQHILNLTINSTVYTEEHITACDSYTWNGQTYATTGAYTYTTNAANGCDSIVTLHLTILPDATTESETLALCPSELPYEWYGQWLTETGTYSATEQYVGMECDSIIHELTLNVYVQTLPAAVTLPIVRTGEAIDVTTPTAEIQAHIAAETWYAPHAEVAWYIMDNSDWAALSAEPVATGITEVTLKYVVDTDCGNVESDKIVINLKTTDMENTQSQSPTSNCQKILYEDHIYILREGKIYSVMGHEL